MILASSVAQTFKVIETYANLDPAGRKTDRKTKVQASDFTVGPFYDLKAVDQSVAYDDLDLPAAVTYPKCLSCGLPELTTVVMMRPETC